MFAILFAEWTWENAATAIGFGVCITVGFIGLLWYLANTVPVSESDIRPSMCSCETPGDSPSCPIHRSGEAA